MYLYVDYDACQHEPHCKAADCCPTGAIMYNEDARRVNVNKDLCNFCGECVKTCPYAVFHIVENEVEARRLDEKLRQTRNTFEYYLKKFFQVTKNIIPYRELEGYLDDFPGIKDIAVLLVDDELKIFIVPENGFDKIKFLEFANKLAEQPIPANNVILLEQIPRTKTGKIHFSQILGQT
ncbi:4Fe-4S binding protein [Carboxydothermus pertinax]|uniref:4Fe-4S ferredoxin n=1 Tax=Carboxydothermus pertinax TaxID=870242 RepID=A0A1L8CTZ7_9THEO|nr:4Fe-4S binding protein [Carboxydothermus pertinax]GAV22405.1 4Fe-4S ferredoxin [Carboxydothermus pertinax]